MADVRPFKTAFPGYFQTAYVTNDIGLAMQRAGESYGIADWYRSDDLVLCTSGGGTANIKVALAYVGESQIELIEPAGGDDGLYRDYLDADGFQLRFHHICKAFETEEQYVENLSWLRKDGVTLPMAMSVEQSRGIAMACYADFRERLGHHLEFVWFTDEGRAWMGTMPRHG
jgi:hypothetical protein